MRDLDTGPGQASMELPWRPGLDKYSQKLLARGRSPWNPWCPVRDQGGIKAGPRRDYILLHLILTDYQLLLFSCIVFRATGIHIISVIRDTEQATGGDLLYWPRPARPPAHPGPSSSCECCCECFCEGTVRDAAPHFRDNSDRDTACCLFFYLR